jgi:hypothetical protein
VGASTFGTLASGGLISFGGGGGGGGGGGINTSWITTASSDFFNISGPLCAVPETSAQPSSRCSSTTTAIPQ